MTEERKQELRQLLQEAMKGLQIRFEYGSLPIPINVYRRYLQERWMYYGVDFLSFTFSTRFTLFIVGENGELKPFYQIDRNSKLYDFIRNELAPCAGRNDIPCGSYIVENDSTTGSRLFCPTFRRLSLRLVLERLLEITIVQGIEEAVSAFDRSSCPEGTHGLFQHVALVEGIKIEREVEIFEGVRLVPLPSLKATKTTDEVLQYLPGFPHRASFDQADSFFGKTLLIIDRPGFSIFHEPLGNLFEHEIQVDDLPFKIEKQNVKLSNRKKVNAFIKSFFQASSLACNSPVQIDHLGWFLEDDKSLHAHSGMIRTRYPFLERDPFRSFTEAKQSEIDKAKCLYDRLTNLNTGILEKLQIPINRWIKSKASRNSVDKMIDLGIAFEALYLSDISETTELSFRLRLRASWHLGKNKTHRQELMKDFSKIYDWRSKGVHTGKLPNKTKKIPFTHQEIEEFIKKAQDLCRQSIIKILEDGKFPDWNNLILG